MSDSPEFLTGVDGEPPYWLRADLAETANEVPAALAREFGIPVEDLLDDADAEEPLDIAKVWLRQLDDYTGEENEQWGERVEADVPGAVEYWWWSDD